MLDDRPTLEALAARLERLEQRDIAVDDLPLAKLTRKLEKTWEYPESFPGVAKAVPAVTGLPVTPLDGSEVYFLAAAGVTWHLRYNAGSTSPYKWEFVGGADLFVETYSTGAINVANGYSSLNANNLPTISVPLAGDYDTEIHCAPVACDNIADVGMGVHWTGTGATGDGSGYTRIYAAGQLNGSIYRRRRAFGLAAGNSFGTYYYTSAGTATFYRRHHSVRPVRVG